MRYMGTEGADAKNKRSEKGKGKGGQRRREWESRYARWVIKFLIINTLTGPGMLARKTWQGVSGSYDYACSSWKSCGSFATGGRGGEREGRGRECNSELSELSDLSELSNFSETKRQCGVGTGRMKDGWMNGWTDEHRDGWRLGGSETSNRCVDGARTVWIDGRTGTRTSEDNEGRYLKNSHTPTNKNRQEQNSRKAINCEQWPKGVCSNMSKDDCSNLATKHTECPA